MTNNPTIDGVSRELLQRAWVLLDESQPSRTCNELRALLGATAVERQEPVCATCNGTKMVDDGELTHSAGGILYENGPIKCIKDCPDCQSSPEFAALQSTIARLEAQLNKAIDLDFQRRETIARLEGKVQELESGKGEPVAWVNGEQLKLCAASPREVQPNNPMMHNLPRNIACSALKTDYCNTPLFAAPPAPVAAPTDLLQRLAYALSQVGKADHLVDYDAVILAREDLRACLDATAALNGPKP